MDLSRFNKYENTKKHLKEIDPYGEDNWEEIDIKEKFIKFLEKNGVYDIYSDNLNSRTKLDRILNFVSPQRYISGAFYWDKTHQGKSFWDKLSNKWEEEISKYI